MVFKINDDDLNLNELGQRCIFLDYEIQIRRHLGIFMRLFRGTCIFRRVYAETNIVKLNGCISKYGENNITKH